VQDLGGGDGGGRGAQQCVPAVGGGLGIHRGLVEGPGPGGFAGGGVGADLGARVGRDPAGAADRGDPLGDRGSVGIVPCAQSSWQSVEVAFGAVEFSSPAPRPPPPRGRWSARTPAAGPAPDLSCGARPWSRCLRRPATVPAARRGWWHHARRRSPPRWRPGGRGRPTPRRARRSSPRVR
jgi:hypothetical protein